MKALTILAVLVLSLGIATAQTQPSDQSMQQPDQSSQQGAASGSTATSPDQSGAAAGQSGAATSDQSGAAADQGAGQESLPQTGSELPLLALLGLGTVGAGVWRAYYKK